MLAAKATPKNPSGLALGGPVPKCIWGPVMGQRLVGTGLDLQEVVTAHRPAEQELRRGASGQHKDPANSRTPGAKVGRDMEGLGEGVVPRSLSPHPPSPTDTFY